MAARLVVFSQTTAAATIWQRIPAPIWNDAVMPGRDVIAGIAAVKQLGFVDSDRSE